MSASYFTFQSPTRVNFNSGIWSGRSKIEPGKRIDMSQATGIIQDLAKKYQDDDKPVQFLDIKNILLVPGTGDPRDRRVVNPLALKKDGIHMSQAAADLVAKKFLDQAMNTPKKWFAKKN